MDSGPDDDVPLQISKGKGVIEQLPAILLVKVHYAFDIDQAFRRVTNDRFYRVVVSVGPEAPLATTARRPDLGSLGPKWYEQFRMPLGEQSLEEAALRVEVVRFTRAEDAPEAGPSSGAHLVGRGEMSLRNMPKNMWVQRRVQLMRPDEVAGWRPEGYIWVQVGLKVQHVVREKIY